MTLVNDVTVIAGTFLFACLLGMACHELGRFVGARDERRKWLSFRCHSCAYLESRLFVNECEEHPLPIWVRWIARRWP